MSEELHRITASVRYGSKPILGEKICRSGDKWYLITHATSDELDTFFAQHNPEEFRVYGLHGWQPYDYIQGMLMRHKRKDLESYLAEHLENGGCIRLPHYTYIKSKKVVKIQVSMRLLMNLLHMPDDCEIEAIDIPLHRSSYSADFYISSNSFKEVSGFNDIPCVEPTVKREPEKFIWSWNLDKDTSTIRPVDPDSDHFADTSNKVDE